MCALAAQCASAYHPVMTSDRRSFLRQAALTAAAAAGASAAPSVAAPEGTQRPATVAPAPRQPAPSRALDAALLAAVGEAVLPEMLGAAARASAIAQFADWLRRYEPVAEAMHGYGDAEITYTPSDPAPGWNAQLAGLDLLARRKHRRTFVRLGVPLRRAVLRTQLSRVGGTRLPADPLAAPHVAVALMAHWAASSEAVDLAYQARIRAGNCRVLSDTATRPLPYEPVVRQ